MSKNRLPPFVPLLTSTLDSPAWKALPHGAKALYVALKRRVPKDRNQGFISYRQARAEIRSSPRKIGEWFGALQHYGFIALARHGTLGLDGKGKAPQWQLTELGATSKAAANGLPEPPTRDFLKWDGTKFKKIESRAPRRKHPVHPVGNSGATPWETPKARIVTPVVHIEANEGVTPVVDITSLPLTVRSPLPPDSSEIDPENTSGVFEVSRPTPVADYPGSLAVLVSSGSRSGGKSQPPYAYHQRSVSNLRRSPPRSLRCKAIRSRSRRTQVERPSTPGSVHPLVRRLRAFREGL